jgi:hypothetical protein
MVQIRLVHVCSIEYSLETQANISRQESIFGHAPFTNSRFGNTPAKQTCLHCLQFSAALVCIGETSTQVIAKLFVFRNISLLVRVFVC